MKLKRFGSVLLLALSAVSLNGCATSAVWRAGQFTRYYEPVDPPGLMLFNSPHRDDVLVEYSEAREGDNPSVRRRAYWLRENEKQIKERRQPKFISSANEEGLEAIPVLQASEISDPAVLGGKFALVSTNGYEFTFYEAGTEGATYELPAYADTSGRTKQILLTPPAVVADAALIAGVAAVVSLPWLWPSLNDWVH